MRPTRPGPALAPGRVRIIGGVWRSRVLRFPDAPGLRPTPDRVRETLFNWLREPIAGAHCLDLFAGSGALGFEAASRGAARVVMVEREAQIAANLRTQAALLGDAQIDIVHGDALAYLKNCTVPFDIVFLDPPYDANLLQPALKLLPRVLQQNAFVYLESRAPLPELPAGLCLVRQGAAGQVGFYLANLEAQP